MAKELHDFSASQIFETDDAILLDCGGRNGIWFPKKLTEDNGDGTYTVPEWLAIKKGIA